MKNYILQTKEKGYCGCYLIALLNARIYYNNPFITSLDDPRWEELVDKYHCRSGSCLVREEARKEIGIEAETISRKEIPNRFPVLLTSFTKVGFHCSLLIDVDRYNWTIVNYDGYKGKTVMSVNIRNIVLPLLGSISDTYYFLREEK